VDTIDTIRAECVGNDELDQLDAVVRQLPANSHLGSFLAAMSTIVRDGDDLYVGRPTHRISPAKAAEVLGMSRPHLYKVMDAGELPYVAVGRDRRISLEDLRAFDQRRKALRKDLAERFAHPSETREAALQSLLDED
jgi:excisionase family DNA binding protein